MKNKKYGYLVLLLMLCFLSACSMKLSDKKETFQGRGIEYTIQLPSTWEPMTDFQELYGNEVFFAASDTKSKSTLIVMLERKESQDLNKNFGETMRNELKEQYEYKDASEIYMKEFKVGDYKGFKYTIDTVFDEQQTWLHQYYIETENSIVQLNYYSPKEGSYKKRAEIINDSALTLKEISESGEEDESIEFKSEQFSLHLNGVLNLTEATDKNVIALRYSITNISDQEDLTAQAWDQSIQVKQNGKLLTEGKLAEDHSILDIFKLLDQKNQKILPGNSVESVSLYELTEDKSNVLLVPNKDMLPGSEEVFVSLPIKEEKTGDNK